MTGRLAYAVLLSLAVFTQHSAMSQTRQKGAVMEMNSGNRPVAGVQVRANGAIPADSGNDGSFELFFQDLFPGDPLMIEDVYKKGFQVINLEKIQKWNISEETTLKIVIGKTGMIDSLKKRYFNIGMSAQEKEYRETLARYRKILEEKAITEAVFLRRKDSLEAVMQQNRQMLSEISSRLACINRDEMDSLENIAISLIDSGKVQDAIKIYESMHTDSTVTARLALIKELSDDIRTASTSLVHSFTLARQLNDTSSCNRLAELLLSTGCSTGTGILAAEWYISCGSEAKAIQCYRTLLDKAVRMEDLESIAGSLEKIPAGKISWAAAAKLQEIRKKTESRMGIFRIIERK